MKKFESIYIVTENFTLCTDKQSDKAKAEAWLLTLVPFLTEYKYFVSCKG